jgi:micrococcal nuclease
MHPITKLIICSVLLMDFTFKDNYEAEVIDVTDGDTITILTSDNQQVKIILEGIDCPEMKQDFEYKAKQATIELCYRKKVIIQTTGKDRYGRTLAYVYVGDLCVNKELLKQGMAWHYKKYNSDPELAALEDKSREMKLGLWSQDNLMPPWEWRKK